MSIILRLLGAWISVPVVLIVGLAASIAISYGVHKWQVSSAYEKGKHDTDLLWQFEVSKAKAVRASEKLAAENAIRHVKQDYDNLLAARSLTNSALAAQLEEAIRDNSYDQSAPNLCSCGNEPVPSGILQSLRKIR